MSRVLYAESRVSLRAKHATHNYQAAMAASSEVAQCLASTLSPDTTTRISAELKLAEYLVFPGSFMAESFRFSNLMWDTSRSQKLAWLYRSSF